MIKILIINANKTIVEVRKKTKLEKKEYSKKDRYTFITPKKLHKKEHQSIPKKKLSKYYQKKFGAKKR